MAETTLEQTIVALSLASHLYLTGEERQRRDVSSLIRHPLHGDILVNLAYLALQEDVNPLSLALAEKHLQQHLLIQTRYDLAEGKLRNVEETAQKLSWTRKQTRRIETAAIKRLQLLETPAWEAFKIFFLKSIEINK